MRQAVSIIVLYALINILSLLFNIISFSTDGKIDIGFLKFIKRMYLKGKAFGSGKTKRILNKEFDIGKSIVIQGASLKAKVAEHTIDTAIDKRDNKKNVKREK